VIVVLNSPPEAASLAALASVLSSENLVVLKDSNTESFNEPPETSNLVDNLFTLPKYVEESPILFKQSTPYDYAKTLRRGKKRDVHKKSRSQTAF
jgi:hypothetical protein